MAIKGCSRYTVDLMEGDYTQYRSFPIPLTWGQGDLASVEGVCVRDISAASEFFLTSLQAGQPEWPQSTVFGGTL